MQFITKLMVEADTPSVSMVHTSSTSLWDFTECISSEELEYTKQVSFYIKSKMLSNSSTFLPSACTSLFVFLIIVHLFIFCRCCGMLL